MAQYKDGDTRRIGNVQYVRTNGAWLPKVASPFAAPALPYEGPQAAANLQRTQQEVRQAEATAAATTAKTKAEAQSAELAAQTAQEQWNINHPAQNGTAGMSGPQYMHYLQQTNPGRAAYIQGLSEGRVPFPSAQMMRTPAGQALLTDVMRADPTIDATNYTTRSAARKNAATGTLSKEDNALITAVGHAAELHNLVPDVYGKEFQPFNSVANFVQGHFFGGDQPTYDMTAKRVGAESAAAYSEGTGGERAQNAEDFSSSLATGQKYKNIDQDIRLLASKLAANRAQFAYGNGQLAKPDFMLLPPQTREQLMKVAPEVARQYFSGIPAMGSNNPPPPSAGNMTPPTGPTGGMTPSTDGYNLTPDQAQSNFWNGAIHAGTPYRQALKQWEGMVHGSAIVSPPDPDAYNKAVAFAQAHPNTPYSPVESFNKTPVGPIRQTLTDAAFSGPGVAAGHFVDSAAANLPTLLAGDQGARYNAISNAMHPNWALFGGDIPGTIAGALGAGKAVEGASPFLGRFGSLIGGNPARAALTGDTAFFGASGAAQNPDDPIAGAALGMASGAAGNLAGRYLVGPVFRKGADALGGMFGGKFAPPAPLDAGQNTLFKRTQGDPLAAIQGNLQDAANLNLPYSLADANPQLRALAGSAVRKSADVRALAEDTLAPRQAGQAERAISQINTNLAPVGDVPTLMADARTRAQQAAAPLYQSAATHPAPNDPKLLEMLDTPAGQQAIRNGYNIALNNGENPGELSFATDAEGNPVLKGLPNWKTLQYAKMGLDKVVTDNANPLTGKLDLSDPNAKAINSLRARFVGRLGELNPDYAAANAAYEGQISQGTAAQRGAAATAIGTTPEQAQAAVANAGQNLPHFQQGYASNLADVIGRNRLTSDPYKLIYGSPFQRQNMGIVFPNGVGSFDRANSLEGDMAKTAYETLGGSPTAARTEADKAFDNAEIATDLGAAALTHGASLPGLGMTALRKFANASANRMSNAKAAQLGPLLLNTDPNANLLMLNQIAQMGAARRAYLQNFGAVTGNLGAGMFGAPILYGASGQ
jgi:hypothetical protein